uniref:molybdenum cofactor guanylyltransferase n=1 Tax=uncultured Draconibacterium sp. TaxID=1573823 RepID=UPI003217722A
MQITAILLAGGKSKRMGTDKALLKVEGISLLEKSVALCELVCPKILISSNNQAHNMFGYPLISDEIENCGPLGGIYSSMQKSETEWNFVISVDSPFVESEFVSFLFEQTGSYDAIVPVHSKGKEPLITLYNKSSIAEMEKMLRAENFKMHNLIRSINTNFIDSQKWVAMYPKLFHNLNRPEDL